MNENLRTTWEIYTSSWQAESSDEKRATFEKCLDAECSYYDPLIIANGWDELVAYMLDFHLQLPGGYFVTNHFLAHNDQSIAKWEMKNGENVVVSEGISYGKYNKNGKLVSMTGFFETP